MKNVVLAIALFVTAAQVAHADSFKIRVTKASRLHMPRGAPDNLFIINNGAEAVLAGCSGDGIPFRSVAYMYFDLPGGKRAYYTAANMNDCLRVYEAMKRATPENFVEFDFDRKTLESRSVTIHN